MSEPNEMQFNGMTSYLAICEWARPFAGDPERNTLSLTELFRLEGGKRPLMLVRGREGVMAANVGDWIVRDDEHEFSVRPGVDWKKQAEKWQRRYEDEEAYSTRVGVELDSTYAHLRAVIENCRHQDVEAIRHQLVGLLPEVQTMEPEVAARMREKNLGHLVDRQEDLARQNWAKYGYGEGTET